MTDPEFSILDAPIGTHPDPDEFVRAAMRWHFGESTGSTFWLSRADSLGFDPVQDIRSLADLAMFPTLVNDLRDVRVEDLIPRGYGGAARVIGVFESGGTTGSPKRLVFLEDWIDREMAWLSAGYRAWGIPEGVNWLGIVPTGPHMVGDYIRRGTALRGGIGFAVDLDPRWVKRLLRADKVEETDAYVEHLVSQAADVLRTQDVGVIATTPPILERLSRHDEIVDLINRKVTALLWAGTHMDADSRHLLRTEVFPDVALYGTYGNTMTMSAALERPGSDEDSCVFDANSPFVTYSVVDPKTRIPVAYGERGQVVTTHVSKSMLLPNNAERDEATRIKPLGGQAGDSVADVCPLAVFSEGAVMTVGVY